MSEKEFIACVSARKFKFYEPNTFFIPYSRFLYSRVIHNLEFAERETLEVDENYRQIIPYCMIYNTETKKVLCYRRAGSEDRLAGKWSVGFGGHWRCGENMIQCITRELNEELHMACYEDIFPIGFVAADATPVDRVHFGIVCLVIVDYEPVIKSEADKSIWLHIGDLAVADLEQWSALIAANVSESEIINKIIMKQEELYV